MKVCLRMLTLNMLLLLNWFSFGYDNVTFEKELALNSDFLGILKIVLKDTLLKYVSKICGLNFEIVAVTQPCIRFFSFR